VHLERGIRHAFGFFRVGGTHPFAQAPHALCGVPVGGSITYPFVPCVPASLLPVAKHTVRAI
jgi:hypothetical protein